MSRAALKPIVSKLRESIIKGIAGKLEKYGFSENGDLMIEKPLSEYDEQIRTSVIAYFEVEKIINKEKYISYVHDTARTFMHILICFKLMEERGIMSSLLSKVIYTDIYNEIIPDFTSVNPIAFDEFVNIYQEKIDELMQKDDCEEDDEYYQFTYLLDLLATEMALEMPLLFRDYEHNLIHPDFDDLKVILKIISEIEKNEYLENDFLGWMYQYWVDTEVSEIKNAKDDKDVSLANKIFSDILEMLDAEQTEFGEFYTPRWVVKHIVDTNIERTLENDEIELSQLKLLDPACGAGNFLVYAFDKLLSLYDEKYPEWKTEKKIVTILEKNIFGADVQREPLQITALNLWIKAKSIAIYYKVDKLNLFNVNILMANSLFPWESEEEYHQISIFDASETIDTKRFNSEDIGRLISSRNENNRNNAIRFFKNKYNVIVMNPPFVDARKMNGETLELLKEYYPNNARNLFSAFIERAIELLDKKGYLGFISSDTFFSISSFSQIRDLLLNYKIQRVDLLGNGIFDGPTVSAAIVFMQKVSGKGNQIEVNVYDKDKFGLLEIIKQEKLKKITGYPFIFGVTDSFRKIFSERTIGDCDFFDVRKGVVTAGNDKYLRYKWEVPEESIGKEFLLYNKEHDTFLNDVKYVLDWRIETQGKILSNSSARCAYLIDNYNGQENKYCFKIGVAYKLVGNFRSCVLKDDSAFDVGTPAVLMENSTYQKYMLALMNSKLYIYLAHLLNPTVNNTPGDVRRLPIVFPNAINLDRINMLVEEILSILESVKTWSIASNYFVESEVEAAFKEGCKTLAEAYEWYEAIIYNNNNRLIEIQNELNNIIFALFALSEKDISFLEANVIDLYSDVQIEQLSVQKIALNFLRNIFRKEALVQNKLYTINDTKNLLERKLEENQFGVVAYKLKEELEEVFGKSLDEVIRGNIKIDGKKAALFGNGMKDEDEPYISAKVIAGIGKYKEVILWNARNFLIEFKEDKRYAMQNEIRRLTDEIYLPKLQRLKEKMQFETLSDSEIKSMRKELKKIEESVKTLENWKVVD